MGNRSRIILDTSALFAGIWSAEGGARKVLNLGELGAIRVVVDSPVIAEIERVLRRKAEGALGSLALLLDRAQVDLARDPSEETLNGCQALVPHSGDAHIIASAWVAQVDYFVTLDRNHFLENPALLKEAPFPLGTPGDFLDWFKANLRDHKPRM
jgi:predicted nucleic acid-binding protein